MTSAVVVGSGPNGLAAAVVLAQRGVDVLVLEASDQIGGGTRSSELLMPGLLSDHCSAVHPMGVASPLLSSLDLGRHGLEFAWPEVDLAHPLDGGNAGVMMRCLQQTANGLGVDGRRWRKLFEPFTTNFDALNQDLLRPIMHVPEHPLMLAGFGLRSLAPASAIAHRWKTDEARALFAGVACHAFRPLTSLASSAIGLALISAGHAYGWPVAKGGSQAITTALAARLEELGGKIETGVPVGSLTDLPPHDAVLLDTSPSAAASIAGDLMPDRVRRAYRRYRHGPGAFKVDFAVEGGIPWTNEACRRAGTVHVGGTLEEMALSEREVVAGRMPQRPYVLLSQQYLADPGRSKGSIHPIWAYAHVPSGYTGDATDLLLQQVERFAPGLRERIVVTAVRRPAGFEAYNANYVGGDVVTGANDLRQVVMRPRLAASPYSTGIPGVYLCSAATPPGAGVHGMCGNNAAESALKYLGR